MNLIKHAKLYLVQETLNYQHDDETEKPWGKNFVGTWWPYWFIFISNFVSVCSRIVCSATGEGLAAMALFGIFYVPVILTYFAFLFFLWIAGQAVQKDFEAERGILAISFRYS